MSQTPIRVAVTGAAGQIGYSLLFRIASGAMFGPNQPVILHLIEIEPALPALDGVVMELDDCAFPLLKGIVPTSNLDEGFRGVNWALLVGSVPRKAGMERKDLLGINGKIFIGQGQAIQKNAAARRAHPRRRQSVQHQLPHRHEQRARHPARPLLRHDAPGRKPRQGAARQEGRRGRDRRQQRRHLGQPFRHAVSRFLQRQDQRPARHQRHHATRPG